MEDWGSVDGRTSWNPWQLAQFAAVRFPPRAARPWKLSWYVAMRLPGRPYFSAISRASWQLAQVLVTCPTLTREVGSWCPGDGVLPMAVGADRGFGGPPTHGGPVNAPEVDLGLLGRGKPRRSSGYFRGRPRTWGRWPGGSRGWRGKCCTSQPPCPPPPHGRARSSGRAGRPGARESAASQSGRGRRGSARTSPPSCSRLVGEPAFFCGRRSWAAPWQSLHCAASFTPCAAARP